MLRLISTYFKLFPCSRNGEFTAFACDGAWLTVEHTESFLTRATSLKYAILRLN